MTPRQRRFAEAYAASLNATQAAIQAGYAPKTAYAQGCRLLKDADVSKAIAEAKRERAARLELDADAVVRELAVLGFSDPVEVTSASKVRALETLLEHLSQLEAGQRKLDELAGQVQQLREKLQAQRPVSRVPAPEEM